MPRRTPYLIGGVLLLFLAALAFIAVLGALAGTSTNPRDVGLAIASAVCGSVLGFMGLGVLLLYRQGLRHDTRLNTVVAILEHADEVGIEEIAKTIQATPSETTTLIAEAIERGSVSGFLDPRNRRFFRATPGLPRTTPAPSIGAPSGPLAGPAQIRFCRECGSRIERASEGVFRCPTCGHEE